MPALAKQNKRKKSLTLNSQVLFCFVRKCPGSWHAGILDKCQHEFTGIKIVGKLFDIPYTTHTSFVTLLAKINGYAREGGHSNIEQHTFNWGNRIGMVPNKVHGNCDNRCKGGSPLTQIFLCISCGRCKNPPSPLQNMFQNVLVYTVTFVLECSTFFPEPSGPF